MNIIRKLIKKLENKVRIIITVVKRESSIHRFNLKRNKDINFAQFYQICLKVQTKNVLEKRKKLNE